MKSFSLFCFLFSSDFFFLLLFCFFLLCYQTITCEMRERKGKKLRIDTGSVCVWDSIDLLVYIFLQILFCIFMQIVRPFVLMQRDMECVCWMIMGLATDIWEVLICRRPTHSLKQTRFVLGDFFFFLLSFKGKFFFFSPFFMWCWRETNGEIEEMYAIVVGMWNAAATTHTHFPIEDTQREWIKSVSIDFGCQMKLPSGLNSICKTSLEEMGRGNCSTFPHIYIQYRIHMQYTREYDTHSTNCHPILISVLYVIIKTRN